MNEHPMQPIYFDEHGTARFRLNAIVRHLLDQSSGLNDLARMEFPIEDWRQFAQLIGYSVYGWGELSYVDEDNYAVAEAAIESGKSIRDIRIEYLEGKLERIKRGLRDPIADLYDKHPDDLHLWDPGGEGDAD